jgi:uncharacterized caspase-like protein
MWRSVGGAVVLMFSILAAVPSAAQGEKRIALLIGNEAYDSEIGRLTNPHNDVALLEQALKDLSFEVVVAQDAGLGALTRAINAYARRLQAAGQGAVGFFYYSGHGASDGTTNYLIPVDVKTTQTGELWDQSLRLTEVTRKLKTEARNATHFVVFDACRNTLKLTQLGSRTIVQSKGFVPVERESGMLVAYATEEGELASDVGGGAGPYARVLAEEIVKPGIEAVVMFRAVQRRVRAAIRQEPYLAFSALGDVYFAGKSEPLPEVRANYEMAERINTEAAWEAFLRTFKTGYYADLARERLRLLQDAAAAAKKAEVEAAAKAQAEARAKAREEEERTTAARKKAEVEAAAKAQAEARAKAREEEERIAAEQRAREVAEPTRVASVPMPTPPSANHQAADSSVLTRAVQTELRRVGCDPGAIDGNWGPKAKDALAQFARHAKIELKSDDAPTEAALQQLLAKEDRVCPLQCGTDEILDQGKCVRRTARIQPKGADSKSIEQKKVEHRVEKREVRRNGHRVTCLQPGLCGGN